LAIVDSVPVDEVGEVDKVMVRPARRRPGGVDGSDLTALGGPGPVGPATKSKAMKSKKVPTPVRSAGGPVARRRWPWLVVAAVVVAALVAAGAVYATDHKIFTASHPIPSLVGQTVAQADQKVKADRFTVHQTGHAFSITLGADKIVSQIPTPRAGAHAVSAKEGTTIAVVVSAGPPPVTIPNLTTFATCNQAIQALAAVHLVGVCPASAAQYSSTVVAGAVLATSPTGTAPYGSTVTIIASKGHAPVAIPVVTGTGTTYAAAAAALSGAGFVPTQKNAYSSTVPTGQVISTTPAPSAGPQPYGSAVTVNISLGPQPVTIPDVVSQSLAAATSALQALGLQVAGPYGPQGAKRVLSTDPVAGSSVPPGTTVDIYTF
jgi:serine/threonine-protein kinase